MKKPTIPPVTTNDPTVTRALASIKEAIELREGDRGDPKDAFVSFRDLIEGGIAVLAGAGLNPDDIFAQLGRSRNSTRLKVQRIEALGAPPAAPSSLTATTSGFTSILLSWEGTGYENHSYTEVWRNTTDDRSTAVQIGSAPGAMFSDAVLYNETYYYWVRFVTVYNLRSGYNSLPGVLGKTNQKISEVIAAQQDELTSSSFATSFLETVNSVFSQLTEPTTKLDGRALVAGDLWYKDGVPNRYDGSAFLPASDPAIAVAQAAGNDAAALTDKKVQIFHQVDEPVASATLTLDIGDLWLDTSDDSNGAPKNITNRWDGTDWVVVQDSAISIAQLAANDAAALADKKVQIFYDTTAPSSTDTTLDIGDLWLDISVDSNDNPKNITNRWDGTSWVVVQDSAINIAQYAADNAAALADKKVQIFYITPAPSSTDTTLDIGDLWLDISVDSNDNPKNITNRWDGTSWVVVQDSGIGIAKGIAEGKTTIFYQDDYPADAASELGDLWVDTDADDVVSRRTGAETWTALGLATNAVVDSKITEQVGVCMFTPTDTEVAPNVATGFTTKTTCEAASSTTGAYSWDNAGAIAQTLDVVTSSVGNNTATISTQTESIGGLNAQYTVKIDPTHGAVSGFGLASTTTDDTTASEFYILADKFGIINSATDELSTATSPFIVANEVDANGDNVLDDAGDPILKTYINSAVIKTADIETLVAEGITADRIVVTDEFTAWRAKIPLLEADVIQDKDGRFKLDMNNGSISVTDANGTLRVKLGKLS